jgi:hypothetical protein
MVSSLHDRPVHACGLIVISRKSNVSIPDLTRQLKGRANIWDVLEASERAVLICFMIEMPG